MSKSKGWAKSGKGTKFKKKKRKLRKFEHDKNYDENISLEKELLKEK